MMKIRAIVKPNSKKGPLAVEKSDEQGEFFEVFVREPAIEGRANLAVVKILSERFGVAKSRISLKKGEKSKFKIFEIDK